MKGVLYLVRVYSKKRTTAEQAVAVLLVEALRRVSSSKHIFCVHLVDGVVRAAEHSSSIHDVHWYDMNYSEQRRNVYL